MEHGKFHILFKKKKIYVNGTINIYTSFSINIDLIKYINIIYCIN